MFHKVLWQHMLGVVGFLLTIYCKFTIESISERIFQNGLGFDRDITMSTVFPFLLYTVYMHVGLINQLVITTERALTTLGI